MNKDSIIGWRKGFPARGGGGGGGVCVGRGWEGEGGWKGRSAPGGWKSAVAPGGEERHGHDDGGRRLLDGSEEFT